jgi:hypothetical protein
VRSEYAARAAVLYYCQCANLALDRLFFHTFLSVDVAELRLRNRRHPPRPPHAVLSAIYVELVALGGRAGWPEQLWGRQTLGIAGSARVSGTLSG